MEKLILPKSWQDLGKIILSPRKFGKIDHQQTAMPALVPPRNNHKQQPIDPAIEPEPLVAPAPLGDNTNALDKVINPTEDDEGDAGQNAIPPQPPKVLGDDDDRDPVPVNTV